MPAVITIILLCNVALSCVVVIYRFLIVPLSNDVCQLSLSCCRLQIFSVPSAIAPSSNLDSGCNKIDILVMPNTPPTPTRRNCFVASRRRRRCVHEFETSSRRLPTDSIDNLETGQTDCVCVCFCVC